MFKKNTYSYTRKLVINYYEALDNIRFALSEEWFWIVSNIDLWEKLRSKVKSDFWLYSLLLVCKADLAYDFLKIDMNYGVFMPCSIAVYEKDNEVYISVWLLDNIIYQTSKDENIKKLSEDLTNTLINIINKI